jgi:hypothetical protein
MISYIRTLDFPSEIQIRTWIWNRTLQGIHKCISTLMELLLSICVIYKISKCLMWTVQWLTKPSVKLIIIFHHQVSSPKDGLFQFLHSYHPIAFHVHVSGVRLHPWTAATNRPIVHPQDDIWVSRITVEWYWQGKTENSEKNLFQCHFVQHKYHTDWLGPTQWEAGD